MRMTIVYKNGGGSFVGIRKWWFLFIESKGTHHFIVESSKEQEFKEMIRQKIAVPIGNIKYFILHR